MSPGGRGAEEQGAVGVEQRVVEHGLHLGEEEYRRIPLNNTGGDPSIIQEETPQ